MPTVLTHPAAALGLAPFFRNRGLTRDAIALGAMCTTARSSAIAASPIHWRSPSFSESGPPRSRVAFFSPVSNARLFFPRTPIRVSPIGLASFVSSGEAWAVLSSELVWVVLPSLALGVLGSIGSRVSAGRAGR
jgi:hypothetical protein